MELMKAARFYKPGQPFKIDKIPIPQIDVDEVLVKVKFCGICGSDLHIFEGVTPTLFLPITIGHEASGEIAKVGSRVKGWNMGDRVSFGGLISCGLCRSCVEGKEWLCANRRFIGIHADGGFAQFVKVKARNLIRLPPNFSFEEGALIEPAGTPFHAVTHHARLSAGEKVAIYGAGGMGMFTIQTARLCGAGRIIVVDVGEKILERAKKIGADEIINATKQEPVEVIKKLTEGEGVDVAIECVGKRETIANSVKSLRAGGRAVVVGIGPQSIELAPPAVFVRSEFKLIGSYCYSVAELKKVASIASSGRLSLSVAISKKIPLEKINEGFYQFKEKIDNPVRILISLE